MVPHTTSRTPRTIAVSLLVLAITIATLGFVPGRHRGGCSHAQGRLFNAVAGQGPGRMIGTIAGDYWIGEAEGFTDPDDTSVLLLWAPSRVEGARGTIYFREYAAVDFDEQRGPNGAVLMLITGGAGEWQDASGHVALSGYFHTDDGTGQWKYEGEVCLP